MMARIRLSAVDDAGEGVVGKIGGDAGQGTGASSGHVTGDGIGLVTQFGDGLLDPFSRCRSNLLALIYNTRDSLVGDTSANSDITNSYSRTSYVL